MGALDFPIVRLSVSPGAVSNRCAVIIDLLAITRIPFSYPFHSASSRYHYATVDIILWTFPCSSEAKRERERERGQGDRPRLAAPAHVYEVCLVLHL